MLAEEQCKPHERFLFADTYYSDDTIRIWQEDCENRLKNKERGKPYNSFINWKRRENEIAIFTMYAYADFEIPKKFDILFRLDNPQEFVKTDYELTQSIYEGWLPITNIEHGHKHLCIFTFKDTIPPLLFLLSKEHGKFISSIGEIRLGFCHSSDFPAITQYIKKKELLKKQYGDNWAEYDNVD